MNFARTVFAFFGLCAAACFAGVPAARAEGSEDFAERAWRFLADNVPAQDRALVSEDFLRENWRLALETRDAAPWARGVPEDVFFDAVLPYSSVGEAPERWRPLFCERFLPLVVRCGNATEAAETLNREIWKTLGVVYGPGRERPDQSPFHSMRLGVASCTGLSILLADACRAVGVPARLVGCRWRRKPGNHTWVEIWDRGAWRAIGAFDSPKADELWFADDAREAVAASEYAIYATAWAPTGTRFPAAWREADDARAPVPARDVTARYAPADAAPALPRLALDLRDAAGRRVSVRVRLVEKASGKILAEGETRDASSDFNRHFSAALPAGTKVEIFWEDSGVFRLLGESVVPEHASVLTLALPPSF